MSWLCFFRGREGARNITAWPWWNVFFATILSRGVHRRRALIQDLWKPTLDLEVSCTPRSSQPIAFHGQICYWEVIDEHPSELPDFDRRSCKDPLMWTAWQHCPNLSITDLDAVAQMYLENPVSCRVLAVLWQKSGRFQMRFSIVFSNPYKEFHSAIQLATFHALFVPKSKPSVCLPTSRVTIDTYHKPSRYWSYVFQHLFIHLFVGLKWSAHACRMWAVDPFYGWRTQDDCMGLWDLLYYLYGNMLSNIHINIYIYIYIGIYIY